MLIHNTNLPTVNITNIFMPPYNMLPNGISPMSIDHDDVVNNAIAPPTVANQDNGFSFVQNVLKTLQNVMATASSATDATTTDAAPVDTPTTTTLSNPNPIGALQVFLYDLNQALTTTPPASAPVVDGVTATLPPETKPAYDNSSASLQNLITSLGNGSNQNSNLQTDFSNVIQSIGGSPSSVSLVDFLKQLAANVGNGDANALQNNVGNLFVATA